MLKSFLLSTVITVATTTLTGLFIKCLFAQARPNFKQLKKETGHLVHFFLGLSSVGLFVLLCAKKVT